MILLGATKWMMIHLPGTFAIKNNVFKYIGECELTLVYDSKIIIMWLQSILLFWCSYNYGIQYFV